MSTMSIPNHLRCIHTYTMSITYNIWHGDGHNVKWQNNTYICTSYIGGMRNLLRLWVQPSEWTFCELKLVHYIGSRSGSCRVSGEEWRPTYNVSMPNYVNIAFSQRCRLTSGSTKLETCSKANCWKTTTQALNLSAHLLSILHCCVRCYTFI